jgi:selenide,water dikinase
MLEGSAADTTVVLDSAALPALEGVAELLRQGYASSLAPANAAAYALLEGPVRLREPGGEAAERAWRRDLLIDPQTCGPLLAALPVAQAAVALAAVRAAGFAQAALIGQVERRA